MAYAREAEIAEPEGTMPFQSINPATEEMLGEFDELQPDGIERALAAGRRAFASWHRTTFDERSQLLRSVAKQLRKDKPTLAGLITAEMGKPIVEAEAEIEKCAWNCEFYAEAGPKFVAPEHTDIGVHESYVAFEPLGTVLAIMPWNFPFWQVVRFLAPALMAGNTAVLK